MDSSHASSQLLPLCADNLLSVWRLCSAATPSFPALQRQQSVQPERHKVVVSTDGLMPSTSASYADEEGHKYARRAHPLRRTLQRLFPNMFAPGLPVTNRSVILQRVHAAGCFSCGSWPCTTTVLCRAMLHCECSCWRPARHSAFRHTPARVWLPASKARHGNDCETHHVKLLALFNHSNTGSHVQNLLVTPISYFD
jgi:hypothetical protein